MDDPFGPIQPSNWRNTPCIIGRPANEADVLAGAAVFYVKGDTAAATMELPCCAIQTLDDGTEQEVIVIQAEIGPRGAIVLGVRPLTGGNAICLASEVHLLPNGFKADESCVRSAAG